MYVSKIKDECLYYSVHTEGQERSKLTLVFGHSPVKI